MKKRTDGNRVARICRNWSIVDVACFARFFFLPPEQRFNELMYGSQRAMVD